jgi:uncharacterized iron-regulated membrane protein
MEVKKTRTAHFWIGLIASLFLFIESGTGIIMYFNGNKHEGRAGGFNQSRFSMNAQNESGANTSGQNGSGANSGNETGTFAAPPNTNQFQGDFPGRESSGFGSMQRTVRELHTGFIGLISSIATLILTGTGLFLSVRILIAKRKTKNKSKIAAEGV